MRFPQIAQRAFNAPLLVDPAKAQAFLAGFGARVLDGRLVLPSSLDVPEDRADRAGRVGPRMSIIGGDVAARRRRDGGSLYTVRDGIAVIDVTGTMVHRGAWIGNSSGQTSYEGLAAQFEAVGADSGVSGVALEVDTFGGQAAGCFDLSDMIREVRAKKPVWAFVAESALSAGYAIASQADRIIVPRTGEVGSIGVLTMHVDYSERLADDGIAVSMIYAGSHKVDGNPFEPLPDGVREEMSAECARLREIFAATVAAGRGDRLSVAAAMATEARVYSGEQAVAAGLADEVSDLRSAFAAFAAKVNHRSLHFTGAAASGASKETTMSNDPTKPAASASAEAEDKTAVTPPPAEDDEDKDEDEDKKKPAPPADPGAAAAGVISRADAAALADVAKMASRLGVTVDLAAELQAGTTPDSLRASVLEKAAAKADAQQVSTTHAPAPGPGDKAKVESPIVAQAKKTAAAQRAAHEAKH